MDKETEAKLRQLEAENERLRAELKAERNTIRRAKDPTPVKRPSHKRIMKLVADACMKLVKIKCGWVLSLGHLERFFKRRGEVWELLIQEDWKLSDIFPPTPTNSDKPPRLKGGFCNLSDRPNTTATTPTTKAKPAPTRLTSPATKSFCNTKSEAEIEVLRSEWRLFPARRAVIEEQAAQLGIQLVPI